MQTRDSLNARRTAATLAAMSLLGWSAAQPALAQATPKRTESVLTKPDREKKEMIQRDDMAWEDNDPALIDPAPLSYPFAAPGTLHLNHWTDYTRTHMAPGSVQEEREARRELLHQRMRERQKRMKTSYNNSDSREYGSMDDSGSSFNRTASMSNDGNGGYQNDSRNGYRGGSGYGEMPAGYQQQSRNGYMGGAGMANWTPMAAAGDAVFIVRGTTVLKLNSSDLSVLRQQELPAWSDSSNGGSDSSRASVGYSGSSSNSNSGSTNGTVSGNTSPSGNNEANSGRIGAGGSNNGNSGQTGASGSNSGNSGQTGAGGNNSRSSGQSGVGGNNSGNSGQSGTSGDNSGNSSRIGSSGDIGSDSGRIGGNGSQSGTDSSRRRSSRRSNGTRGNGANGAMMDDRMFSGMASMAPISITAGSDFVYVLRGNTLYQMRNSDLSLVSSKQIPSMSGYGDNGSSLGGSSGSSNGRSNLNGSGSSGSGNNRSNSNGSGTNGSGGNRSNSNGNGTNGSGGSSSSSNGNGTNGSSNNPE